MRELIIRKRCDVCRGDATQTFVAGISAQETRPELHILDLCDEHATENVAPLLALFPNAAPFVKGAESPPQLSGYPSTRREPTLKCELCDRTFTVRGTLVNHVWGMHSAVRRPANPPECPDCGKALPAGSMGVHRSQKHRWDPLKEAYAVAREKPAAGLF